MSTTHTSRLNRSEIAKNDRIRLEQIEQIIRELRERGWHIGFVAACYFPDGSTHFDAFLGVDDQPEVGVTQAHAIYDIDRELTVEAHAILHPDSELVFRPRTDAAVSAG